MSDYRTIAEWNGWRADVSPTGNRIYLFGGSTEIAYWQIADGTAEHITPDVLRLIASAYDAGAWNGKNDGYASALYDMSEKLAELEGDE